MLVLHAFYSDASFCVWGERSFDTSEIKPSRRKSKKITPLPFGADSSALNNALDSALRHSCGYPEKKPESEQRNKKVEREVVSAFLTLPSRLSVPIPSNRLLSDLPVYSGEPELRVYETDAVKVSWKELLSLYPLLFEKEERLVIPGLLFSNDIKFLVTVIKYTLLLISRSVFTPGLEMEHDKIISVWKPLYLARYEDEFSSLVSSVPPILCYAALNKPRALPLAPKDILCAIISTTLDEAVRASLGSNIAGKKVDPANPHEIWLRSLVWPKGSLDMWHREMTSLYPQVNAWGDSVKAVTSKPWKLFMRLEEPFVNMESESSQNGIRLYPKEGKWTLSWHMQSSRDPSLIIPAGRVWSPDASYRLLFKREGSNPRKYMLMALGLVSSLIPSLAESLKSQTPEACFLSTEELYEFLEYHLAALLDHGIQVQFPKELSGLSNKPKLTASAKVKDTASFSSGAQIGMSDLLDVDWSVSLGDDILSKEELTLLSDLKAPLANIRGRWVIISKDEIDKLLRGVKKLPQQMKRKDALLTLFGEVQGEIPVSAMSGSSWLESIKAMLTEDAPFELEELPKNFNGTLRPYQQRGLFWLFRIVRLGLGACLADDMGLGKTIQTLAAVQLLREHGETRPVLLVCPTSVIENWRKETERFTPNTKIMIHHGPRRLKGEAFACEAKDSHIILSSYAILQRDKAVFDMVTWCGVILDEAQNIKNPDTGQTKAAYKLQADWRIALTGTPVENHVGDLWSLMEFLIPGLLPNKTKYRREFLLPIQAGDEASAKKLRGITSPFILRRLKTDKSIISDLPEKIETQVYCGLKKEQATLYNVILSELEAKLKEAEKTDGIERKGVVLAAVTALKQICNHPALYLKDNSSLPGRSGKFDRITEIAEEMLQTGDRALIFTQYAEMGHLIKRFLQETFGREVLFLHGGSPRAKRDEMVRRFQESENPPPFFVLSLKAGGTGLNLTGANHVIMFDRWWNPAVEQQAVDRAYRIGQRNNVQVHYFCCKGTLEEKIEDILSQKRRAADLVVSSGEKLITEMSNEELHRLFALANDALEDA